MSGDGTLRDKDGYVYRERWPGHPEPVWDTSAQAQKRDRVDLEAHPASRLPNGTPLYRPLEPTPTSRAPSSTADIEGCVAIALFLALFAVGLVGVVILATPLIAPVLMAETESARNRRDMEMVRARQPWAVAAAITAIPVVLLVAGAMAYALFSLFLGFANSETPSLTRALLHLVALGSASVAFLLLSVTGLAPTTIVFLNHKESGFRQSGKRVHATLLRRLKWTIGLLAAATILVVLLVLAIAVLAALVSSPTRA